MSRADDKREAFAAWDSYEPELDASIRRLCPDLPHDLPRAHNPLMPVIFADGYLRGREVGRTSNIARQALRIVQLEQECEELRAGYLKAEGAYQGVCRTMAEGGERLTACEQERDMLRAMVNTAEAALIGTPYESVLGQMQAAMREVHGMTQ